MKDSINQELWVPVAGFPEIAHLYDVSNTGKVRRSFTQKRNKHGKKAGELMSPILKGNGYLSVNLNTGGKHRTILVHTLVALAFLGDKRPKYVNHKNFIRTDNRVENLEWVTPRQNSRHSSKNGRFATGDRNGSRIHPESRPRGELVKTAKLNPVSVIAIRRLRSYGIGKYKLASAFGVSEHLILRICKGVIWKWVKDSGCCESKESAPTIVRVQE